MVSLCRTVYADEMMQNGDRPQQEDQPCDEKHLELISA